MTYPSCKQCKHCEDYKQYQGHWFSYCSLSSEYILDDEKIKCGDFEKGEVSK